MLDSPAHYVKPAGRTFTPAAVMFLDTETQDEQRDALEVHTLRLWECQLVRRRDRRRPGEHLTATGTDHEPLAELIDSWASYSDSAWLYAHNVTFDLTVTNLAYYLGERGWVLSSRFAVGGDSMWAVFHKGAREVEVSERRDGKVVTRKRVKYAHTLTIADSSSLFPCPLATLGPHVGVLKPEVDFKTVPTDELAARCHADVDILRLAVLALMDWWDENDLGHWTVTGAGQAWQTYKRTLNPRQLVIDHDPGILEIERAAVYGGRRDVLRVGPLPPGRYAEIDFTAAYTTVAAEFPLPARASCKIQDQHRRMALHGNVPAGMLAEVTINTDVPRWPVRVNGRVFYPVGRFRTVLAAPDIQAAADAHALEAVHEGWLFTLTNHLRDWARLVLSWVNDKSGRINGVIRIWAKLAARAVIGKFAQRGWTTTPYVGPPCDGWSVEQTSDLYTGMRGVVTGVNGDYWISWADQRGEHERPAVLAFVEAHVRRRLGAVLAGPFGAAVMQCDTDGFMASHTLLDQLAAQLPSRWVHGRRMAPGTPEVIKAWNEQTYPLVLREKTQFNRATVYGPQHVVLDGKPRFAGVAKRAWQVSEKVWLARLWPGMTWQSQHSKGGEFARPVQQYTVAGSYAAGWALEDGAVRPAETTVDAGHATVLLHWKQTRWAASGAVLGANQARWADGLWEVPNERDNPACGPADGEGSEQDAQRDDREASQALP